MICKRTILLTVVLFGVAAQAQQFKPPQNRNAALRYWIAFAELQDRPADEATTKLIESVLAGDAAWDEQRLGPMIDQNDAALRIMQRGTSLPECNWGLEYERGGAMSLAHLPKARALARLNALYGARLLYKGDSAGAVAAWIAGLRFAQHMNEGISLIGVLSAKPGFMADLRFLTKAVQSGVLSNELLEKVRATLRTIPQDGLNWSSAVNFEAWADESELKKFVETKNFDELFRSSFSRDPGPATQPTASDLAKFHAVMNEVVAAFQLPSAQTKDRLEQIQITVKQLDAASQAITPNYLRTNEARRQVAAEREVLEKALANAK